MKARDMSLIALMAAIIGACSWISVPAAVPFTMQTFGVFAALLMLGGRRGTAAIALYIAMGIVGVPVFSGFQGGIGHILGPTGGYIIGFLFIGALFMCGEPFMVKAHEKVMLFFGLLLCYLIGTIWFMKVGTTETSIWKVLSACVLPYVIPDLLKLFLADYISRRVRTGFNL